MFGNITAEQIIQWHKNPVKSNITIGEKKLEPEHTEAEQLQITEKLNTLKNLLSVERVERRNARAEAIWMPDQKRAKVTRIVGNLSSYGYRENGEYLLLPEEAMFLLEMNRLELLDNGIPFSIEKAYSVLLNKDFCSLEKYRIYQNLALQGFRVKHSNSDTSTIRTNKESTDEPQTSTSFEHTDKKIKLDPEPLEPQPGTSRGNETDDSCYNIYSDSSHTKIDHNIVLQSSVDELNDKNISTCDSSILTSFSDGDSVAFYKLQYIDFDKLAL